MLQGLTPGEAVRLANEKLGEVPSTELAGYIQEAFGLTIKPPIVTVLLGTFQERQALDRTGQATYAKIDRWKLENPDEAKKIAALVKRRETAKRKKAEAAAAKAMEAFGPVPTPAPTAEPVAVATPAVAPEGEGGACAEPVGLVITGDAGHPAHARLMVPSSAS